MRGLTLRLQLGIAVIVLYVIATGLVATVAYRASRNTLEKEAVRTVGLVAQSRERATIGVLESQQERLEGFLGSVESLCSERAPSGRLAWETECVRVAVTGFHSAERAAATELGYRGTTLAARGSWWPPSELPPLGQLARITASAGHGEYTMQAVRGQLVIRTRFPLDKLDALFQDMSGLAPHGEVFLTDRAGHFLTTPRYAIPAAHTVPMAAVERCVQGSTGEMVTVDYRDVPVISGFRPVSALGGGCIVANVAYHDALAPVYDLSSLIVYASITLVIVGALMSSVIARIATRQIDRLVASAQALAAGEFGRPVSIAGSSEMRQLGQAFSTMAASIGDLVQREHQARLDAEAANRTKDEFLAMLSHELRTPLNAILGWASILGRGHSDSARVTHAARVIERNARVQSQMIEDLLDVSRAAAGTERLHITRVPVAAAIDSAVEVIRPAAESKHIDLRKRIDVPDTILFADPQRLQQILWNLLSNAIRFTPAGGSVEIAVSDADDGTDIGISDTGIGIPSAFLPHVFERFRQADSSTTRVHGGLGLGLAIVRDLVHLHGGTVRAESRGEGFGATFTVHLPAGSASAADMRAPVGRPQAPVALDGARVLAVDDDPDTREVLRTILEDAGAVVTVTSSAQEARMALQRVRPDLLIADIGMPGEDGYSLMKSIRTIESGDSPLPAIALTAHAGPQDVERALSAGFQLHVAKPIDSSRLVASIARLVQPSDEREAENPAVSA